MVKRFRHAGLCVPLLLSAAQVIRTPAGKGKDWQYYEGADKKLTMPHPPESFQRVCSCARVRLPNVSSSSCNFASIVVAFCG